MAGCMHTARQQVLRVDRQTKESFPADLEDLVIKKLENLISKVDAILVSDYGIGTLSDKVINRVNEIAKDSKIPVVVDSRYKTFAYKNITVATPNEDEASKAINMPITLDIAGNLRICNHSPVVIGNIYRDNFENMLTNDYIEKWEKTVPEYCSDCDLFDRCFGGCRAAAEQLGLSLDNTDPVLNNYSV